MSRCELLIELVGVLDAENFVTVDDGFDRLLLAGVKVSAVPFLFKPIAEQFLGG